jgi:hypothetical protein
MRVSYTCQFQGKQLVQPGGDHGDAAQYVGTPCLKLIAGVEIVFVLWVSNGTDTQKRKSWSEWESFQLHFPQRFSK